MFFEARGFKIAMTCWYTYFFALSLKILYAYFALYMRDKKSPFKTIAECYLMQLARVENLSLTSGHYFLPVYSKRKFYPRNKAI